MISRGEICGGAKRNATLNAQMNTTSRFSGQANQTLSIALN